MFSILLVIHFLLIFACIILGTYIVTRDAKAKRIIIASIIISIYSFYFSGILTRVIRIIPYYLEAVLLWIIISIIVNRNEGLKKGIIIGFLSYVLFLLISIFVLGIF